MQSSLRWFLFKNHFLDVAGGFGSSLYCFLFITSYDHNWKLGFNPMVHTVHMGSQMFSLANLAKEVQIAYRRRIKLKRVDLADEASAPTE
ncbi:Phosphoenolpyruvate carboxylase [Artemisia annua]|uniref:Phosphoenolpyruvate carboxylase n=1 Tax=Artemisia annua TaxID=35608 RepID=A0A2U1LTD7_ARTAN|nr:Phosphoenolpyruvate carboxylase [Artemisia annua]